MPNNSEYWQQRFILLEEARNKENCNYIKMLKAEYDKSLSRIEKDITSWYTRIAVNNQVSYAEAKKMLNKKELQEFKWAVEEYIEKGKENAVNQQWIKELENASARVHIDKLEAIKIQVQNELEHLHNNQNRETTSLIKNQFENTYYKSAYEIQKGLEQFWNIQPLDANKIEKIISKPWTTDEKTFSDRIWKNKAELTKTLQTELIQATIRGDKLNNVINTISKEFNKSKGRAGNLVMTESAFFSSVSTKECFNNLNVQKYEIVATLDSHTSEICQEMDGKVFDMKDYQAGITAPPFHCRCRSTTVPYFNDEFTIGEQRAYRDENGKTAYVDSNITYKQWKEKYVTNNNKNGIISKKLGNSHGGNWGGTGKGQFIEKINKNEIYEKLLEYENDIRNMKIEYGILINKDCNIFAYTGTETNLDILDRSLDNAILTHNHPDVASFGKDDFELLINNNKLKELRAVDKEYTYSLKLIKTLDLTYNEIYKEGLQLAFNTGEEIQHCTMEVLKEKGYIKYERRRKK